MQILERLKPLSLLLLRLALGVIFIHHGYPKLFGNVHHEAQQFAAMGFPGFFAPFAGVIEFFGGLLLIAGLFTRIAGILLAGEMFVALWRVHRLFADPMAVQHYEFPLALCVGAFVVATAGPGIVSLDHLIYGSGQGAGRKPKSKG
ncbi:MAG TPA: DoxX family protein [Candidatus Acidoferrales bacterium]|nr:DoxX family protein [Candidatus Acidoferrales bacterium]